MVTTFDFHRFRFRFRAVGGVCFPAGRTGNLVRGAFGAALRATAPPEWYRRLFEPGKRIAASPSGLADWPRPFVFRTAHLQGTAVPPGGAFSFDMHVFDLSAPVLPCLREALAHMGAEGIGPGRGRAALEAVEVLDLSGTPGEGPCRLGLNPGPPARRVSLRFVTPTELKASGEPAGRPRFPVLFARLRDRISTLRALYGAGPLEIDFRGLGERAEHIRLCREDLSYERRERRSGRTGQVHPLGGFTGSAEYERELGDFLPWLRAARWVGVGRQTVWGNGEVWVTGS
jgi:hypothetical protein